MNSFLTSFQAKVKGTLSGFDRVRFRGTLRFLANTRGLAAWLFRAGVLWKDYKDYARGLTDQIKQATERVAQKADRPLMYLPSSNTRKEDVAREIAERDQISEGLVCVLTCVEPCATLTVGPNKTEKTLELRAQQRRCLHHYFYLIDRHLGWLNVRLQTWLPFTVQIVINGREWLSRDLVRRGVGYERRENCFTHIDDLALAQKLMDRQLTTDWTRMLNRVLRPVHPRHRFLFGQDPMDYYWSADQTEWATDVMFQEANALAEVYPHLTRHAITTFQSGDVLRFLGKRPRVQCFSEAEILSHWGSRPEGVRIKHALDGNSIKMYDKQESVLRVETTITQTRAMKVYRASESDPEGPQRMQRLRKGVADLHRRAEISQKSNERYLEALGSVESEKSLGETTSPICRRTTWKGRSVRALNPLGEDDGRLLEAVSRGEFALQGFRNRDLVGLLFGESSTPQESRRHMAKATRLIRLLRAHGLVQKVPKTHRYIISPKGRETITGLLAIRGTSPKKLTELAA